MADTAQRRDFLLTVSTDSPDEEIAAQLRGKARAFVVEASAIIGDTDGRVNITLQSSAEQSV